MSKKLKIVIISIASVMVLTLSIVLPIVLINGEPITHTITYNLNYDESPENQTISVIDGTNLTQPQNPLRNEYYFSGWFINLEGTGEKYDFDQPINNNLTLYAKWLQGTEGLTFELINDNTEYEVSGMLEGYETEVVVLPALHNNKMVTKIGYWALKSLILIETIYVPDTVTIIDESAFSIPTLETIFISWDNLTSIGGNAFYGSKITQIEIPSAWTVIEQDVFAGIMITEIAIPNKITQIGNGAFYDCIALTTAILPNSLTSIGENAFWGTTNLESIFFVGTETEWNLITMQPDEFSDKDIYYYSETPVFDGDHWHYNEVNAPTIWTE